jgi:hemolysin activation/secretion protein
MRHSIVFTAISVFASAVVYAQNIPDAGSLMRQTEQNLRLNQAQPGFQKQQVPPPAMSVNESTLITAQRFKFVGNKLLTAAQLQLITESFTNKELNQHDLQMLTEKISDAYRQSGWLVQVYIPQQPMGSDELVIQVLESLSSRRPAQ